METLLHIDRYLFEFINHDLSNRVFDLILVFFRNKTVWLPLYLFLISFFIFNFKKKGILVILFAFAGTGIADYTSSSLIKPAVERIRPCNNIQENPDLIKRVNCGSGYSFPSSHATNHFSLGVFFYFIFLRIYRRYAFLFLIWAAIIAFAQVYVGVHYPIDVFAGAILGSVIGYLFYRLCSLLLERIHSIKILI
jgi:membrane-associated phospholipid phosphatase